MTQEEKELFIQDIGARLLYHPIFKINCSTVKAMLYGIEEASGGTYMLSLRYNDDEGHIKYLYKYISQCKIYLRPMKSMTKGEKEEYRKLCKKVVRKLYVADGKSWPSNKTSYRYFGTKTEYYDTYQSIDYLISRHFDYRGLIGKKLALKATKGMYEF